MPEPGMADFWDGELTEEKTSETLERLAASVRKRRLEMPAILALEMHKPLSGFLANSAVALSPFLVPFFGFDATNDTTRVLERRANVERLITMLETPQEDPCPSK